MSVLFVGALTAINYYSDNGTTFKGANHEIHKAFEHWHAPSVKEHVNKKARSGGSHHLPPRIKVAFMKWP